MDRLECARRLIRQFKGDRYLHGFGVLAQAGPITAGLGRRAVLVRDDFPRAEGHTATIRDGLDANGVEVLGIVDGAAPTAPREDLARITAALAAMDPDVIVSFGGGSPIDA